MDLHGNIVLIKTVKFVKTVPEILFMRNLYPSCRI